MRVKKGFTFIEVTLFLAISSAIFAMVVTGISSSIAKRRYNDAVSDVVEQIRNAYSSTINVENIRTNNEESSFYCTISSAFTGTSGSLVKNSMTDNYPGRTRCAVYGQVITFGEEGQGDDAFRYDIIGLAEIGERNDWAPTENDSVIDSLERVYADIVTIRQTNSTGRNCTAGLAGTSSWFSPEWKATIEKTESRNKLKGAIIIVRSPISGTIHTYFYATNGNVNNQNNSTFEVQKWLGNYATERQCESYASQSNGFLTEAMRNSKVIYKNSGSSENASLDLCIGSDDLYAVGNQRRAIRIHGDGSNESSVELLTETESATICKK